MFRLGLLAILALALVSVPAEPEDRAAVTSYDSDRTYFDYVSRAPEFRSVRQDPAVTTGRWNTWLYMPWRFQWRIGTGDEGGKFCREYGINGGVSDHAQGPLPWLERWNLRFYNDHTAGKGGLYLYPEDYSGAFRDGRSLRSRPLDAALRKELEEIIAGSVRALRGSPMRVAYALDDEPSWGSFTRPIP